MTPQYIFRENIDEMISTLNNELIKVSDWISSNRLTINVSKTFYMGSSLTNINESNMNVKIKNNLLNNAKFLGVTIDCRLTWKPHLHHLCMKMSQITGILYKIRNNVTVGCLKLIYMSTVYPHLMYCSAI